MRLHIDTCALATKPFYWSKYVVATILLLVCSLRKNEWIFQELMCPYPWCGNLAFLARFFSCVAPVGPHGQHLPPLYWRVLTQLKKIDKTCGATEAVPTYFDATTKLQQTKRKPSD